MVLLTLPPPLISAITQFNSLSSTLPEDCIALDNVTSIEHRTIHKVSQALLANAATQEDRNGYRLSSLLKGCDIYIPPKPPKPEPTPEYKALMSRLRAEAEEREYSTLTNKLNPTSSSRDGDSDGEDEYSYQDLKSHLAIIANVLLSILATSAAVWKVASGWDVPERMALAFTSSLVVGVAEVVVFGGYLRRIDESRQKEKRRAEKEVKTVVNVWELGPTKEIQEENEGLRKRRG